MIVVLIVRESGDSMKEFKSTDDSLNIFYENLHMLMGDSKQERTFTIGVLTGAVAYSYIKDIISYDEYSYLLDAVQEVIN